METSSSQESIPTELITTDKNSDNSAHSSSKACSNAVPSPSHQDEIEDQLINDESVSGVNCETSTIDEDELLGINEVDRCVADESPESTKSTDSKVKNDENTAHQSTQPTEITEECAAPESSSDTQNENDENTANQSTEISEECAASLDTEDEPPAEEQSESSAQNGTTDLLVDSVGNNHSTVTNSPLDSEDKSNDTSHASEATPSSNSVSEKNDDVISVNSEKENTDTDTVIADPLKENSNLTNHVHVESGGETENENLVSIEDGGEKELLEIASDISDRSNDNEKAKESQISESESQSEPMEVDLDSQRDMNESQNDSTSCQPVEKMIGSSDSESCIIPDAVDSSSAVNNNETKKTSKKFDIMPVRLEKLMDPQKLISKIAEDETNALSNARPQRQAAKKAETQIKEIVTSPDGEVEPDKDEVITTVCTRCCLLRACKYIPSQSGNFCLESCHKIISKPTLPISNSTVRILPTTMKFQTVSIRVPQSRKAIAPCINPLRKCAQCDQHIILEEKVLSWEAMEFCNDDCLNRYQKKNGSYCQFSQCEKSVPHTSMGKYAVRFGLEARQFCSGTCLEEFKKVLKSCGYCQKDVTKIENTIRVTSDDKHSTREFCSTSCKKLFDCLNLKKPFPEIEDECTVCTTKKIVEFQVLIEGKTMFLCSEVCFSAFKFANNISETDQCHICKKYYEPNCAGSIFVFHDDVSFKFCSKVCTNVFILFRRKIVPCSWCKVKKYNFDMIKKTSNNLTAYLCSINCLTLYHVSINATTFRKIKCDFCSVISNAQYHLTMSDATIRNFCSYNCVMNFQTQYSKNNILNNADLSKTSIITTAPVPLGEPKKVIASPVISTKALNSNVVTVAKPKVAIANGFIPQITASGTTLKVASPITMVSTSATSLSPVITSSSSVHSQKQTKYVQQIIVKPPEPKEVANKSTQCRPLTTNKSVMCKPANESVGSQTEESSKYPAILPIPVPIYVPVPVMYSVPYPDPVPFPVPIPVPVFIPTTQKTFKGLTAKMKEILDRTPSNPYEADLLVMAKMVASEEPAEDEVTDSENLDENAPLQDDTDTEESEALPDPKSSATDDVDEEMSSKASNDISKETSNSRSVDLEAELASNTITPTAKASEKVTNTDESDVEMERPRTRKRVQEQQKALAEAPPIKTRRRQSQQQSQSQQSAGDSDPPSTNGPVVKKNSQANSSTSVANDGDRPDAGMYLKYTIGIRGWKQWILQKNEQIEQAAAAANKKAKTFNTNILKLTTDELNYLLCRFVKEIRKPNGSEYAPDTIYYLCLSIQQYLSENGRVDNIFTDPLYDQFTDALDEEAVKFSEINESTQYILTRVEEEHLWESKQLGAFSPHVLLATLMFFNTKYFNLTTIEEHMQLSFSHIMKHWKRNSTVLNSKPGSPAPNRNILLRFYPPQAALDAPNSRKKKMYEQHENEGNPLRCPVKLYEFYLSKCPESVKQRTDLFYLQPESSCVPDSPVWYSTMPLQREILKKILHRILMVKEVNIALLAS